MGWMHDTLAYAAQDPIFRKYHHDKVTFRMLYAFNERYVLPLSHDEVVHGKASLVGKMPGDEWQRYATLRAVLGEMFAQPGKKLLFMGGEFGQWSEWAHERSLDWHLLQHPPHRGLAAWVRDLNRLYAATPAMHAAEHAPEGFYWIDCHDADNSVYSMVRQADPAGELVLAVINFTPLPRADYRVGAPRGGFWREALNSDAQEYGGSGTGNLGGVEAERTPAQGQPYSLRLTLPPLAALFLVSAGNAKGGAEAGGDQQPR
jgi:1,4-alpha-glucan branching enzyme